MLSVVTYISSLNPNVLAFYSSSCGLSLTQTSASLVSIAINEGDGLRQLFEFAGVQWDNHISFFLELSLLHLL